MFDCLRMKIRGIHLLKMPMINLVARSEPVSG